MFLLTFKQVDYWLWGSFHTLLSVDLTISYFINILKIDSLSNKISNFFVSGISSKEMLGNTESLLK